MTSSMPQTEPRTPTKLEMKRARQHQEKRQRLINKGVDPSKVEEILAVERYRDLPTDTKLEHLQVGIQKAFGDLHRNDQVLAESMDINLRILARCLEKAGVSTEEQRRIAVEVEQELLAARAAPPAQAQPPESEVAAQILNDAEKPRIVTTDENAADSAPGIPEGASVFGG